MKNFKLTSLFYSRKLTALILFFTLSWMYGTSALAVNRGFEAGLTGWTPLSTNGIWASTALTGQYRSGLSAVAGTVNDMNGTVLLSPLDLSVTIPSAGNYYVTVIAWIKNSSGSAESGLGLYQQHTGTQQLGALAKRNTSTFTRASFTMPALAGETYRVLLQSGKDASGGTVSSYFDDIVIYYHTNNVPDYTSPAKPTTLYATNNVFKLPVTCTLGADAETAVDGGLLLRTPGFVTTVPTLTPQTFYSNNISEGPATIAGANGVVWEVIDNNYSNGSFPGNPIFSGNYTYLAYSRDMGVNYSAAARMLAINNTLTPQSVPASISVDGLYIPGGTTLVIPASVVLTLNNWANIPVEGTLINRHDLLQSLYATVSFEPGSFYEHATTVSSKKVPAAIWKTNSTCLISGVGAYLPLNLDQDYYHFIWNSPAQSATITPVLRNTIFRGNFTVNNTGAGKLTLGDTGIKLQMNFIQTGGIINFYGNQATLTFEGALPQQLQRTGGTLTGLRNVTISNTSGLTLLGSLSINGNLRLQAGILDLNGNVLTAENGSTIYRTYGEVSGTPAFSGAISVVYLAPVLTGSELPVSLTALRDLTISTPGVVTLANPVKVNNNLTFQQGSLAIHNVNLTIAETGDIIGAGPLGYVITNGLGSLTLEGLGSAGTASTVEFPVGSYASYSPASIRNTATIDNFSIRVMDAVYTNYLDDGTPVGTSIVRNIVNKTWLISEEVPGGSSVSMTLAWQDSDEAESFDRNQAFISHYKNQKWNATTEGMAATSTNTLATSLSSLFTTGIEDFSPFGVGDSDSPLPVELVAFKATLQENNALITWKTAMELNNDHFEIERSTNGREWVQIGSVLGGGTISTTQSYHFLDQGFMKLAGSGSYYRLKQVDTDGSAHFSPVSFLAKPKDLMGTATTYFEAGTRNVVVKLGNVTEEPVQVMLSNSLGQIIAQKIVAAGQFQLNFEIGDASSGIYFVTLLNGSEKGSLRVVAY